MTVVLDGIEEVLAAVGRHFGYSDWLLVDAERAARFAEATGDSVSGAGAAPENLTLALSNYFLPQIVRVDGVRAGVNYGADRVRFLAPLRLGRRLRAGAELLVADTIVGGVQTTMRIVMEVEDGDQPVCVIDSLSRFLA